MLLIHYSKNSLLKSKGVLCPSGVALVLVKYQFHPLRCQASEPHPRHNIPTSKSKTKKGFQKWWEGGRSSSLWLCTYMYTFAKRVEGGRNCWFWCLWFYSVKYLGKVNIVFWLLWYRSLLAFCRNCYGASLTRSRCVPTGRTRIQFWVWCPENGFRRITRWYPQCCSCYRWAPCPRKADDKVKHGDKVW
jgi:hypothetical protein